MAKDQENGKRDEKSLHFFVPVGFHRRLKMVCAYEGQTLKAYVVGALQEALIDSENRIAKEGRSPAKSAEESSTTSAQATNE